MKRIDFNWAAYKLYSDRGDIDHAIEILKNNRDMLKQVEKEYPAELELSDEEMEKSYQRLVERMKREGIWKND